MTKANLSEMTYQQKPNPKASGAFKPMGAVEERYINYNANRTTARKVKHITLPFPRSDSSFLLLLIRVLHSEIVGDLVIFLWLL